MKEEIAGGFLATIANSTFFKTTGYLLGTFFFVYLNIPQEATTLLAMLMVLDTFTGIAKVWRIDGGKAITSHELGMGAVKKILVFIVIVGFAIVVKGAGNVLGITWNAGSVLSGFLGILMIAEFYSICQNMYMYRTGKRVTEYDATTIVLRKIGEFMKDRIENFLVTKK